MKALAASLLVIAACHETRPAAQQPARIDLSDPLSLVPADSDFVIALDVGQLRRSPLWTKYERETLAFLAPGFAGCSYDPLADITLITTGVKLESPDGFIVVRGLDRDKTLACLRAAKTQTDTTTTFDGDFVTLTNKSGAVNIFTFVDPRTRVMQGSKHPSKEQLVAGLKMGAPLRHDPAYVAVAAKPPHDAALVIAMRPGANKVASLAEARIGAPVHGFYMALAVTERLELHIVAELATPEAARSIVSMMRPQLAAMKTYVDRYDARAQGNELEVDLAITEPQLHTFIELAKTMAGGRAAE